VSSYFFNIRFWQPV